MGGGDGFEWDQQKSDRNFELRGFNFATAELIFRNEGVETDARPVYRERRFKFIGTVDGIPNILVVIWTPRNGKRRIISARPASKNERAAYAKQKEK
ncbi:MAG: BrnT family toxin [Candidatus Eremiobacteraeota bacterium]|nr:BrnT family toxin [Candidatus Eremiobacteraeota bacterium]